MFIKNFTPHPVTVCDGANSPIATIPSSGIARCASQREIVDHVVVDGTEVPITRVVMGELEGLPAPEPGTILIVSALAGAAAKAAGRSDVVIPDDAVRDGEGRVVGCRAFARP